MEIEILANRSRRRVQSGRARASSRSRRRRRSRGRAETSCSRNPRSGGEEKAGRRSAPSSTSAVEPRQEPFDVGAPFDLILCRNVLIYSPRPKSARDESLLVHLNQGAPCFPAIPDEPHRSVTRRSPLRSATVLRPRRTRARCRRSAVDEGRRPHRERVEPIASSGDASAPLRDVTIR